MKDISQTLQYTSKDSNDDLENTTDSKYLKKMQDILVGTEFPSDFDSWIVQEQHDWMYHNITELYQNVPKTLQYIIPAIIRPLDVDRSQEKLPEWMDMDKYRKAQKFIRDNYFSIIMSLLFGIIYNITFDDVLKPVIISGKSNTPYLAFKRYLGTIIRILNWHSGEPWIKGTKAYKDMKIARIQHREITTKISRMNNEQINAAFKNANSLCLEHKTLLKNFAAECPFEKPGQRPYKILNASSFTRNAVNNGNTSIIQGSLILLPIMYPQNIGIHDMTDDDQEAFCHMWKYYGYVLGVEDEYNFCRGSLEQIKQRLKDLSRHWIMVNFTDITPEWMHIITCIAESLNYYPLIYMPHKSITLLFTEMLSVKMPDLYASLNYREWIVYKFYNFLLRFALKFSVIRSSINRLFYKILETASNFGPDKLAELQKKSKQYLRDFSSKS